MRRANEKLNVILYCRVSSDEQAEGCSLDEQERQLRAYCTSKGYNVIDVYREDYSAQYFDMNRPEFKKIYDYCRKNRGRVDKILFLRWDRYSRNVEFAFAYKRKFYDELGVELNTIESPIDFKGTEWPTTLAIFCSVAHTEDVKISRRTRDGIHGTLLKGKWPNRAPRGYKNVNNGDGDKYVAIDEPKAKLVRYVFEEVAKGTKTPTLVWREVQKKGLKVSESSFFEMLRNCFYCGEVYVPPYLDEPAQIVKGIHEPLISKETFMQVQNRLHSVDPRNRCKENKQKAKIVKYPHEDYYFYPFLRCPICGEKICASHSKGRSQTYAYYHCNHCKKYRIPAQQMNDDIIRYLRQICPCKAVLDLYEEVLNDIRAEKYKGVNKEKNRIQDDIKKVEVRLQRLQDRYMDEEISPEDYRDIRQRYQDEIYALKSQAEILKVPNRGVVEPQMAYAMSFINNIERCLNSVEISVKMDVLGSIFSGKMVFENGKCRTAEFNPIIAILMGREPFFNAKGASVDTETPLLYPEPGSNRHGLLHWCLRPARLPIPPSGLVCFFGSLSPGLKEAREG